MTMEPNRVTDPKLLEILHELIQREPIFHRPELGTTRADFEAMTKAARSRQLDLPSPVA